jgi:membrane dipeptidase
VICVDGLIFKGDGWNDELATSGLAAMHVTAGDFLAGFEGACAGIAQWWETFERDRDHLFPVLTVDDLDRVGTDGRLGVVLGLQNGKPIGEESARVELLWRLGIRVLQLTYNEANLLGDGCLERRNGGLTKVGEAVVRECNRSGILVDLSHVGERTALDAVELSTQAVAVTHGNRFSVDPNPRNKSDGVLRAVAASGGVVGVSPYGLMCWTPGRGRPRLDEDFVRQAASVLELLGEDAVAIGTDLYGVSGDVSSILGRSEELYPEVFGAYVAAFGGSLESRYSEGLRSPADWQRIPEALARLGLGDESLAKICGGNWLRLWRAVWGSRERRE